MQISDDMVKAAGAVVPSLTKETVRQMLEAVSVHIIPATQIMTDIERKPLTTYTRTFIVCPHCGAPTESSVDHLKAGQTFGPWYCEECGGGFQGKANGAQTEIEVVSSSFRKTLDLLVLEPQEEPVYFVMKGFHSQGSSEEDEQDSTRFFYEEHSCPTNWIRDTAMISVGGDVDPHGFLKFVRSVPQPKLNGSENQITEIFPEVLLD